ncbi:MAG: bifunctional hydroxymethylpyrimidine kinase/phosphomethylpyrimidine kinase [Candidatus Eisenbacteria bacterium]|nr:bifunctional hydroxymethylpyrimidine kinase/phosphomethylpyrimidine kinase [Candidatus Eisenbacteria bacterium]
MKPESPDRARLKKIVRSFRGKRVLVVGDLMLDEYVYGSTNRISREAPVLILDFNGSTVMPGGAGNACANVSSLGAEAVPIGVVGDDPAGVRLLGLLGACGVETGSVECVRGLETIQKTRILAGGFHCAKQQVIRLDVGKRVGLPGRVVAGLLDKARAAMPSVSAVLFSDYGYGAVDDELRTEVIRLARARKKTVCVDSRFDLVKFRGATVATPNEAEAGPAVGIQIRDSTSLLSAGEKLVKTMSLKSLIVTQGSSGMTVFGPGKRVVHVPIFGSDEIADVTGAGDTVAAAVSLSLACGADVVEASCVATYASSIVVMKRGTAVVSAEELLAAVSRGRIRGVASVGRPRR